MFSKLSRYRKLPNIVATNAQGRAVAAKSLRLLPAVSGTFRHTLEAGDRLDHLAYRYYKQSTKWWRICDANPEFLSPLALLGKDPIAVTRFPLTLPDEGGQPPWAELRRQLSGLVGVERLHIEERVRLVPEIQTIDGETITVHVEHFERSLTVVYNRMNVSTQELADTIVAVGFAVSPGQNVGRVGKEITIPPNVVG